MPGVGGDERHVAIIGGGIVGASSLYYLSQAAAAAAMESKQGKGGENGKLRLTLIEESPNLAPGASGKSGGFLAEDWHGADTSDLASLSFRLHRELAEKYGGEKKWGYRQVETYSIGFDEDSGKKGNKCPKELDWIEGKYVTNASKMGGGGTTAQVTPLALVEHLVQAAKENSSTSSNGTTVDVLLSTRAERVEVDEKSGHISALVVKEAATKEERRIPVDDVVIAAGPWTGKLIKSLLPKEVSPTPSFFRNASRITGSRAHSIVVKSPKPTTSHCLFTDMHYGVRKAGGPELYARADGTVYACGGSDNVPLPPSASQVIHDPEQTAKLIEQVKHLSPSHLSTTSTTSGATITKEQACYLPVSPRGPTIAQDRNLGLYVAAGHSCWGITLGPGTGKVISEMVLGQPLSADISALS